MTAIKPRPKRKPAPVKIERFQCPGCGTVYPTAGEAQECIEAWYAFAPTFKVGDIVTIDQGYNWIDGDRRWAVSTPGKGLHGTDSFILYYVVTYVDQDTASSFYGRHRPRYHLATRGMKKQSTVGWTFDEGHFAPRKVPGNVRLPGYHELLREYEGKEAPYLL